MKKIFKYQVQHNSGEGVHPLYFRVNMPKGAQILSAGEQEDKDTWVGHSSLYIWAIVDPDKPIVERTILDVGTGMVFDKDETFRKLGDGVHKHTTFIGTVQRNDGFVWHIFDAGETNDER